MAEGALVANAVRIAEGSVEMALTADNQVALAHTHLQKEERGYENEKGREKSGNRRGRKREKGN